MAVRISRAKLAKTVCQKMIDGDKNAIKQLAAFLVTNRRTREAGLIARDLEAEFAKNGHVLARVTSPRKLSDELQTRIEELAKDAFGDVRHVSVDNELDESLLAGMKVDFPGKQIDLTAKAKLEKLAW